MPLTTIQESGTKVIGSTTLVFPQTLHPAVMAYINQLSANSYAMSSIEIQALNNLVLGFIANGIWDLCDLIYPAIGNSSTTMKWNLKDLTTFPITFFGSWTFASTGMKPTTASTSNYALTGYTPSVNGLLNDAHISLYGRTNIGTVQVPIGCWDGTNFFQINMSTSANSGNIFINGGQIFPSGITNTQGEWYGQRSSSVLTTLYINGVSRGTSASASTARPTFEVALGARRAGATVDFPSAQEIAFVTMGKSMTETQVVARRNLVQAYQTALSRNV